MSAPAPDARRVALLRRRLGAWYRAHARDLPWRRTRDPYAVWISEAMLQQTRVEAVREHYARFLERFPDVRSLAAAREEDVLAAWSGLGYYRRARALHAAARHMVEHHAGAFPDERAAVLALPGVGRYTAGAVLSIAFGRAEALVDGNVARVFARWFAIETSVDDAATRRRLWELAEALVPAAGADLDPGDWNQALMELGAVVCTPRAPDCAACPVAQGCEARARGLVDALPRRAPKRDAVDVGLEILVVRGPRGVLFVRRPAKGRMAGLWELPTREPPSDRPGEPLWPADFPAVGGTPLLRPGRELGTIAHAITHHRIRARVLEGSLAGRPPRGPAWRWVDPPVVGGLPTTGMTPKALTRARG